MVGHDGEDSHRALPTLPMSDSPTQAISGAKLQWVRRVAKHRQFRQLPKIVAPSGLPTATQKSHLESQTPIRLARWQSAEAKYEGRMPILTIFPTKTQFCVRYCWVTSYGRTEVADQQ